MKNRFRLFGGFALAALTSVSVISAQEKQPAPDNVIMYKIQQEKMMQEHPRHPSPAGGDVVFFASEMSFDGKLVKGAPYSAEAVTESTQTLSDGNRIVSKSTASIYRDSEGRTRREQSLKAIGPYANQGAPSQTIHLSDPVAGVSYVLSPGKQVAWKMPPRRFPFEHKIPPPDPTQPAIKGPFRVEVHSETLLDKKMGDIGVFVKMFDKDNRQFRTESLGRQDMGGVEAEGEKTIITIAAGDIGNERPIEIVSERWYSPELQIVVMSKNTDPRFGENTYRLINIDRTEPARSLFEVPAGYKIEAGPGPGLEQKIRIGKPAGEQ